MEYETKKYHADLVIVGAGVPGICAAVQAAREGLSVALINDRGVMGGNGSCEIGVILNGAADGAPLNINSREGGIINEIITEWKYRSPISWGRYIQDAVFIDIVDREPNIKIFLNTCIDEVENAENGRIISVSGTQNTTETRWKFTGHWFVDDTGDGTLGYLAGAEYMMGREAGDTFGEKIAPDKADKYVLPSTLTFHARDMGYKVAYTAPDFAFDITEHLGKRIIPQDSFHTFQWYYEIGGEYDHVKDREEIIKDHKSLVYGIWDYIKNSGKFPQAENYDFEYISTIPGTREYRRLKGDYILTENDIVGQIDHEDAVGHGGWNIDLHAIKGFFDEDIINRHILFQGIYKVPYRTVYSKNIDNMFMCGRCMSVSHVALGSIRVISSLSTMGQAVGMAASLCKKYNTSPRGIYKNHIKELQQKLLREDQLITGLKNQDKDDLALSASVSASSRASFELTRQKNVNGKAYLESLPPVYRGWNKDRYDYEKFTDKVGLGEQSLALSLPIDKRLDQILVKVRSSEDTKLEYNIYLPEKPENYGPDKKIGNGLIEVKASDRFDWIKIPINLKDMNRYVLLELVKNEHIDLALGGHPLPTTLMFCRRMNQNPCVWDVKSMDVSKAIWERTPYCICFKTEPLQNLYTAENVNNGFNRAYGKPNMWVSDKSDHSPSISLSWDTPQTISRLNITFGPETYKQRYLEVLHSVDPLISPGYRIYSIIEGKKLLIKEVKDNFSKLNKIAFDQILSNEITIEFSPGSSGQVALYEIRAYA